MNTLLENPLPIAAVGAMLATLFGLIFLSRRSLLSLVGLGAVVLFTSLLLITEQLIVTPREEIEAAIGGMLDAIEANDVTAAVAFVDPQATELRRDVETLMPTVDVDDCGATAIQIDVDKSASPMTATANFKGRLRGVHRSSGMTVGYFDQVDFAFVYRDDRWTLADFTAYWKGKPLDAVGSLRGKQPMAVPAR